MTHHPGKENTVPDAPVTGSPAAARSVSNDHLQLSDVLAEEYKALYRPLSFTEVAIAGTSCDDTYSWP